MFSTYYTVYWNKKTPNVKHTSFCSNDEDLAHLIKLHENFEFDVYILCPLTEEELQELLESV